MSTKNSVLINEDKQLLLCGGAVGHLMHLYDNRDLTFREIKRLLMSASKGKLNKVSEKLDGMNLVVSWDVSSDDLRAARNSGDIKRGGLDAGAIASKFFGRGNVEEAFTTAFKVLKDAISAIPDQVKTKIFGGSANRWYSVEIIYVKNPNVINYDNNHVVFHGWPIFDVDSSGNVSRSDDDSGVAALQTNVEKMQKAVTIRNWRVMGPVLTRLKSLSDGSIVRNVIGKIEDAMSVAGVSDNHSIGDYLRSLTSEEISSRFDLDDGIVDSIVMRVLEEPGAPSLNDLKRLVPKDVMSSLSEFVKSSNLLLKKFIAPIEDAVNDFAIEVLNGLHSMLIDDSDAEVARLRGEVSNAINAIESSGQDAAMEILNRQLVKLKNVENITAAMEGVVFIYKGNAYKLTGSFAQVNTLLGLFRYGRKGISL